MPTTATPSDLVERLTAAASAAIANEAPELGRDPGRLRGIVIDLRLNGRGAITEGTAYIERRVTLPRGELS